MHTNSLIQTIQSNLFAFDDFGKNQVIQIIKKLALKTSWKLDELQTYYNQLIFLKVYAYDQVQEKRIQKEMLRLASIIKNNATLQAKSADTGLPFTTLYTRFSFEFCKYLLQQKDIDITIDSCEKHQAVRDLLLITLPYAEKEYTTADLSALELLETLKIPKARILSFLIEQIEQLPIHDQHKEYHWQQLEMFLSFKLKTSSCSIPCNALSFTSPGYHSSLLRKFDVQQEISKPLPPARNLSTSQQQEAIRVIRYSMMLTHRETDTATYMAEDSLRFFDLERGYAVALYGMRPPFQLPMQSYIGYTLFKNGYPMAYGGSWILGSDARFGLNLFEWFRGGESAFVFAQLLRVYIQVFSLKRMEVDAYQFGKDNPDGIQSGAFWFYYRFGFRPMDKTLESLAEQEKKKMERHPAHRSSIKTLLLFTESNMALTLQASKPMPWDYALKTTSFIQRHFKGNRAAAVSVCADKLKQYIKPTNIGRNVETLEEWGLFAEVYHLCTEENKTILAELIQQKTKDPYRYNTLLLRLFSKK